VTVRRRDAGRPRGAPVVDAVLAAVRAELAERGAEGLSVERVAARAEVNKTSVYRRWPTREALVVAAMEGLLDDLSTDPDHGDVRSDLLAVVTPIAELAARPDGAALLRAAVAQGPGEVSRLATRRLEAGVRPIPGLAARAAARGQWRPGVDPGQVVLVLVGAIMHRVLLEGADPTGAWLEGVVDLTVTGLLPRPGDD
jgi:AcrR family transcriptional regulator